MAKKKVVKDVPKHPSPEELRDMQFIEATRQISFTTSKSYWDVIVSSLEARKEALQKEVDQIQKVLPDSESYWTMDSMLYDVTTVTNKVKEFYDRATGWACIYDDPSYGEE